MHTPSLFVASLAVLSTLTLAEPNQPKFYFPRHIKRPIFQNTTITTPPAQETPQDVIHSTRSTKRTLSLSDFFNDITGQASEADSTSDGPSGTSSSFESIFTDQPTAAANTNASSAAATTTTLEGTTTIIIQHTTFVGSDAASTPVDSSAPLTTDGTVETSAASDPAASTPAASTPVTSTVLSADPAISEPASSDPASSVSASSDPASSDPASSDPAAGTTGAIPPIIVLPTTGPNSVPEATSTPVELASTADPTSSTDPSAVTFGPGGVLTASKASSTATDTPDPDAITSGVSFSGGAASTAPDPAVSTATSTTDEVGLGLLPILSSVGGELSTFIGGVTSALLPTPASTTASTDPASSIAASTPVETAPTSTPAEVSTPVSTDAPAASSPVPTDPPAPATTSVPLESIVSSLLSTLDPLIPITILPATTNATDAPPTSTEDPATVTPVISSTFIPGSLPPDTATAPVSTPPPATTPTDSVTVIPPPVSINSTAPVTISTPPPLTTDIPPPVNTNATNIATATDSAPTTLPTGILTAISPTAPLTTDVGNGTATATPTTSGADLITSMASSAPTSTDRPFFITPTGSDQNTTMWLPATIIAASSPNLPAGVSQSTVSIGIASSLPKVITNPDPPEQPVDTTEIQIGFLFALNYPFVVDNPLSSAQIFKFLPKGIADGLGLKEDQVVMKSLLPLDTTLQMGFITTLALLYIPVNMVSTLSLDLHIPTSAIYNNPDASVNTLVNYINPAIPLAPGSILDSASTTSGGAAAAASSSSAANIVGNNGVFNTESQSQSAAQTGTTAGLALGAVGGAVAYGAAMFLLARRYKNRKQGHRRSNSLLNPSEMRQSGSPALMGGALMSGGRLSGGQDRSSRGSGRTGNSARTAQISAPMMAENSLGWN